MVEFFRQAIRIPMETKCAATRLHSHESEFLDLSHKRQKNLACLFNIHVTKTCEIRLYILYFRNNTSDKLHNKLWRENNVKKKNEFEVGEMILMIHANNKISSQSSIFTFYLCK